MMQLETFVAETLKQIIHGVAVAQEHAFEKGASVNPSGMRIMAEQTGVKYWDSRRGIIAQDIEFDVAVTTTEGMATKGAAGVFVGPVALGSQGQSDTSSQSVSRIRFSVPVLLPATGLEDNHPNPGLELA